MSITRRVEALERRTRPVVYRPPEWVEVFGLPPEERERRIRAAEERAGPWWPGDPPRVVIVDAIAPAAGDGMLERRVTNLERRTVGGHVTLVRLFARVRASEEGRTAPPLCGCPVCTAMVAELYAAARANRRARREEGSDGPDATH